VGPTSHDVVARVRKTFGVRRVGHTGTLDPFASGLLVVLVGRVTRLARFVEDRDKTYLATAALGVTTDTDDRTGQVTGGSPRPVSDEELTAAVESLIGTQLQRPPAFSARHVDGRRSYQLARRGVMVEHPPTEVVVHELQLVSRSENLVSFRARVSRGTYIRALARDLGQRLGTGAHLTELRREQIGDLDVADATPLAELGRDTALRPAAGVLAHLPAVELGETEAQAVRHGRAVPWAGNAAAVVTLHAGGRLLGIAQATGELLRPVVVLEDSA
jgi:tRNA pseudouridine55 synthase